MTEINITQFAGYDKEAFLHYLSQEENELLSILIPKRTTTYRSHSVEIYQEYACAAYIAEKLFDIDRQCYITQPALTRKGHFIFEMYIRYPEKLATLLEYLAPNYEKDFVEPGPFLDAAENFVLTMPYGKMACPEYGFLALLFHNTACLEYEEDDEEEERKNSVMGIKEDAPACELYLEQLAGQGGTAALGHLDIRRGTKLRVHIPKESVLGESSYEEIAMDYTLLTYIGQQVWELGHEFYYEFSAMNATRGFCFEIIVEKRREMLTLLERLVAVYSDERKLRTFCREAWDFLNNNKVADVACAEYYSIAFQFWFLHHAGLERE